MEINLTKINLTNSIANNVVDYVQQFEKKHMEVEFNTEDPIYVLGNEEKINRIIQNLMKNALNYSDGDVVIDIFIKDESIILSFKNPISDSNEINIDNLFDKFYVAEKSRGKSTGLGLSISRILIEQMNGTISAQYENGKLRICIRLPEVI